MLEKVNLKSAVNSVDKLYVYDKIGQLDGHVLSCFLQSLSVTKCNAKV